MGCDIHLYIEHAGEVEFPTWRAFGGRINPGRDYVMFGILAGVRDDRSPLYPVRGLPSSPSLTVIWDNQIYVNDQYADDSEYTSRAKAESWVASGISYWTREDQSAVSHPDWHTRSWLTLPEWESCIAEYEASAPEWRKIDPEYHAVTAALKSLADAGRDCRVVFWFDN